MGRATRDPCTAAIEALRAVTDADGLVAVVKDLLADHVYWAGAGRGGECRSRTEVLQTIDQYLEGGLHPRLRALRAAGSCVLLEVELVRGGEPVEKTWMMLTLNTSGRVVELQDYPDEVGAHHDLKLVAAGGSPARPSAPVSDLVPFVHVADVARSVDFYRLLGFEPTGTREEEDELVWAALASGNAALMLARAEEPVRPGEQAVLFYLYAHELRALRDHLVARGMSVSLIVDGSPGPSQEMRVTDPDGYCLMVAQVEE